MEKHHQIRKQINWCGLLLAIVLLVMLTACGDSSSKTAPPTQQIAVTVTPASPSMQVGGRQQFAATVTGTSHTEVTWSVQEANGGTIDAAGQYAAPMKKGSFHVVATSQADATKSASAAVTVTAPAPIFGEAPTAAAEGAPYTYAVNATDPAGTNVTLALTAAPEGASLSGNTVSWIPTWAQSRKPNELTITATSDAGGTATQTWSVSPEGTVYGYYRHHFWGTGQDFVVPGDLFARRMSAYIPGPDGLRDTEVQYNNDGTFMIPNVPAGPYYLAAFYDAYRWEDASTLRWDWDERIKYPGTPLERWLQLNVSGVEPVPANDWRVDIRDRTGILHMMWVEAGGQSTLIGSSSWTTHFDVPENDSFLLAQYRPVPGTEPFTTWVIGPSLRRPWSEIDDGTNANFQGVMTRGGPTSTLELNVPFSEWAEAFATAGPVAATPRQIDIMVSSNATLPISAFSDLRTIPGPELARAFIINAMWPQDDNGNNTWPADKNYGSLQYNNPFEFDTTQKTVYSATVNVVFSIPFPNSSVPLPMGSLQRYETTTTPFEDGIVPMMLPPGNAKVDDLPLLGGGTIDTTIPTMTWDEPLGKPSADTDTLIYSLDICEPSAIGGAFASCSASFTFDHLPTNSFTVPAGVLEPGHSYIFRVTASSLRDSKGSGTIVMFQGDPTSRSSYPFAQSDVVSAAFTVSNSAPSFAGVKLPPSSTAKNTSTPSTRVEQRFIWNADTKSWILDTNSASSVQQPPMRPSSMITQPNN